MRIRERPGVRRACPLCFEGIGWEPRYRCPGCGVDYHAECAGELGGCGTLGCARNGCGPHGPASLAQIRRHLATVARDGGGGAPTPPPGTLYEDERAAVIREALLARRARLIATHRARIAFERARRRNAFLRALGSSLLLLVLFALIVAKALAVAS